MRFFDYIFYRVSDYYAKRWHEDMAYFYGMTVVGFLWVTLLSLVALLAAILWEPANHYLFEARQGKHMSDPSKFIPVLILFGLLALRYLRYKKYEDLARIWGDEDLRKRRRRGWMIAAYVVVSFGVTTWLAVHRKYYM
jgi:hypothetical protein